MAVQYNAQYFQEELQRIKQSANIPLSLGSHERIYINACRELRQAYQHFKQTEEKFNNVREKNSNSNNVNKEEKEEQRLSDAVKESNDLYIEKERNVKHIANNICQKDESIQNFLSKEYDDSEFLKLVLITLMGGPNSIAKLGQEKAALIDELLTNTVLLPKFLYAGGSRKNCFCESMIIFKQLCSQTDGDPVLERLSLAISLELSCKHDSKVCHHHTVNPVARFQHYKHAYYNGELDPIFSQLSTWELRFVIDTDASEDEIQWGRDSLRNYRPDIILTNDPKWRYARIVKTDVAYKKPDWYKENRTYDQILSGGGKCGPRAGYGRFICKAFGIPVWGCKQPGHAAMVRWTTNGWDTALGGGLWKSRWEDITGLTMIDGLTFEEETKARYGAGSDEVYAEQVYRLEWLGLIHSENRKEIISDRVVDPNAPWYSLAQSKRADLARMAPQGSRLGFPQANIETQLENLMKQSEQVKESIKRFGNTTIVPAAIFSKSKQNKNVTPMKSFSGGMQLFLGPDSKLEYDIPSTALTSNTRQTYNLMMKLCTVHRDEDPVKVEIAGSQSVQIPIPYTNGYWAYTDPVKLDIAPNSKLRVVRPRNQFGIALKSIELSSAAT